MSLIKKSFYKILSSIEYYNIYIYSNSDLFVGESYLYNQIKVLWYRRTIYDIYFKTRDKYISIKKDSLMYTYITNRINDDKNVEFHKDQDIDNREEYLCIGKDKEDYISIKRKYKISNIV